jgi:peptidoglycan hydrolase-like protein with peptidoglycan-binding domain
VPADDLHLATLPAAERSWADALRCAAERKDPSLGGVAADEAAAWQARALVARAAGVDVYGELRRRRAHDRVDTDDLHPVLAVRVLSAITDHEAAHGYGSLQVLSGARTYAEQAYLYATRPPGYAANPDVVHGSTVEGVAIVGSNHQMASDGWGRAVDFLMPSSGWGGVHSAAARHGLRLAVLDPYEPWHFEATESRLGAWLAGPWPSPPGTLRPLRLGLVGGDCDALARQLGLVATGTFGAELRGAVRRFQRRYKLVVDGVWGPICQERWTKEEAVETLEEMIDAAQSAMRLSRRKLIDALERNKANPGRELKLSGALDAQKAALRLLNEADEL